MAPVVKYLPANAGDMGLILGSGRCPGGEHGNLLQFSCLENPMDCGAWWAAVHGAVKSRTRLSDFTFTFHFHVVDSFKTSPGDFKVQLYLRTKSVLLLLSRFSRVRLCVTPLTAAHQAPLSLGFSRHEHWSGLPFPSPMHESEK